MKRATFGSAILAIAAFAAATIPAAPAMAQSANAAQIIKDGGCGGFVPTADGGFSAFIFTPDGAHAVKTSAGTQSLICQFDIPAGLEPASSTHAEGFGCGTYFGYTTDSKMIATPGGRATLICKINGQDK